MQRDGAGQEWVPRVCPTVVAGRSLQLLSLVLATRYRKHIPTVLGVLVATLISHAASGAFGAWLASVIRPEIMNGAVVESFALIAVWILIPDKFDDADAVSTKHPTGSLVRRS